MFTNKRRSEIAFETLNTAIDYTLESIPKDQVTRQKND